MQESYNRTEKNWVLGVTSLASFMMALDSLVITTAFAAIRADFATPVETLQWAINAFNLTFAVLLLTGAALGDRFGRRRVLAVGIGIFVMASAACALSANAGSLIAARAAQGAGAAMVMPIAMAILSGAFPRDERARALGIFSGVTGCALIIGPTVGGLITGSWGWRWIFWINLPIGLVLAALVLKRLRESYGPRTALDGTGMVLIAIAALLLAWGLLRGNSLGWTSPEVAGALFTGLLLAMTFVAWELRASTPMIPMRLFASRSFAAGLAASVLFYAAMYGVLFLLPQFLQTTLGFGPLGAGLRLLPWTSTLFVTAPVAGAMAGRFGERPLIVAGVTMQAVGFGWIAAIASPEVPYATLVAPLVLAGVGVSMAMPAAQNAVLSAVVPAEMGKASGVFNMARFLGAMFGIAAMVAAFNAHGAVDSAAHFSTGFTGAMVLAAALSLLAVFAGLWLPAPRRAPQPQII